MNGHDNLTLGLFFTLCLALASACGDGRERGADTGSPRDASTDTTTPTDGATPDASDGATLPPAPPLADGEWVIGWGLDRLAADGSAVAADAAGSAYIAGEFVGTIDFGDGPRTSVDGYDLAIVSLTPEGTLRWATTFEGTDSQRPWDIAVGGGIVAVAGELKGSTTFGGTTVVAGATDGFVVALDADDGRYLWHWVLDSGPDALDYGYTVAVDDDGTVYTVGDFDESVTIGGFDIVGGTFGSTYIARLSRAGELEMLEDLVGLFGRAQLALGPDGLYLSSEFRGSYDFGSGPIRHDSTNPFLLALDLDAAFRWVVSGDGPDDSSSNSGNGIGVAPDGSPWMLGSVQREVTFAGTRIVNLDEAGTAYFAHLAAADGAPVLISQLDGLGGEYLSHIDFAADGRAMLAGSFSRTFERDGTTVTARTDNDLLFVCLESDGALCAARGFGGPGRVGASDIAAGASGDVYIVGAFNDNIDFGGTTLTAEGDGAWMVMHLVL